ncbi:MAG TPA: T9SS type A sorting domain-containing protein [Gemmatimonadota bacterium]|nr:T9SS type A sorting domain-containing protein [Gemmatimonadota bacterium]
MNRSRRGPWTVLATLALLLGIAATASSEPPEPPKDRQGRTLTPSTVPNQFELRRNRVILLLTSNGQIGATRGSVAGGGFWIATTNQYIFSSGPNVGATLPATGDTVVAIGGPFSQFPESAGTVGIPGLDVYWTSTDPADLGSFPEVCTVDAFRTTQFPSLAPFQGEPFPGFADETVCIGVSDLTGPPCGVCEGTRVGVDIVETMFAFGVPSVQDFVFVAFRVFNRTEFINAANAPAQPPGPYDLENTIVAIAIDPDIGDSGDDQIAFLPEVQTMVFWDSDFTEPQFQGTPGFGGITYLKTPVDPNTNEEVGLREFTVFTNGAPRPDPNTKEEWYQLMTGDPTEAVLSVSPQDVRGMASSGPFTLPQGGFVEIYAAYFFANVSGSPPAQLLAEPYKDLRTGVIDPDANSSAALEGFKIVQQTAQAVFDAGFVVPTAPPKPDIELIPGNNQVTIVWNAGPVETVNPFAKVARDPFARLSDGSVDPLAPPVLDENGEPITLDPDQVIFVPDRDEGGTTGFVTAAEAGLSGRTVTNPAFEADFTIQDFQGFNVYRSRTGLLGDAELIAQFDLVDAVASGNFCISATAVFDQDDGEFEGVVCTSQQELAIGSNSGLSFAIVDRGGSFPSPSTGPGLINGIPVFYTVTSFAVNTGQSPVDLPVQEAFEVLVPPAAPLVLEGGLAPLLQATPRSDASSFAAAGVGDAELLDGDGNVIEASGDIPIDAEGSLTGPIPAARDFDLQVEIIQPLAIPSDFEVRMVIDSAPVSPGFAHGNGCGSDDRADACVFGIPGVFDEVGGGDGRSRQVWFHVEDGSGNTLETPTGPAVGVAVTQFIAFGFDPPGATAFSSPTMPILSPIDPSLGTALTVTFSSSVGDRGGQCSLNGVCVLTTPGGNGAPPASVADFLFSRGLYGQYRYADIELTWSNQGGQLGLSSVRDVSNAVNVPFNDSFDEGWGFAKATGLAPEEAALAAGLPTTADGKFLFPEPYCGGMPADCTFYGFLTPFTQSAPVWTDLPFDPDVFEKLEPFRGSYAAIPDHQPGALAETAALVNVDGQQGTRLYIAGHWLDVVFSSLPADGETWLVRLPNLLPTTPRPPVPGQSIRASVSGGTNDLADADLSAIRVVPNPFVAANEITRGNGLQRILFTNLPPQATIRIYTISGNLVRVLEHTDGSGTEEWDVRTRFDLLVASGNYYFHVTTPDGRTHLGRFAVVN